MANIDLTTLGAPVLAAFGEAATFAPATGGSFAITGVFDEAWREVSLGEGGQAVTTAAPVLGVRLSDFASPPLQGDQVTIARTGEIFVVKEVRPDSHGWALLLLNDVG